MDSRRLLQIAMAVAGLVPVLAGGLGVLLPERLHLSGPAQALTHAAYLSGLLLGLGLGFWSLIPTIERQSRAVSLLAGMVVIGGLARALTAARLGAWDLHVIAPLIMELGVTPLLWAWQRQVAKRLLPWPLAPNKRPDAHARQPGFSFPAGMTIFRG